MGALTDDTDFRPISTDRQDAEKRILNGKCQMEDGKTRVFFTSAICRFTSGHLFSAAC